MRNLTTLTLLLAMAGNVAAEVKTVSCEGTTVITAGGMIGAQAPYHAIFEINGDTITMIEKDDVIDAKTYVKSAEISLPDRPGYASPKGNLFLYLNSGTFWIFRSSIEPYPIGTKTVETKGTCQPYTKSSVFN
ncbi:MAG: hypothetical protein ACLGID_14415 [Gammaproteobacteria bacterium]